MQVLSSEAMINRPNGPGIHDGEAEALTHPRLEVDPFAHDIAFVSADGAGDPGNGAAGSVSVPQLALAPRSAALGIREAGDPSLTNPRACRAVASESNASSTPDEV